MNILKKSRQSILESQLPTHLVDIVHLAKAQLGWTQKESTEKLFFFFLRNMIADNYNQATITRLLNDGLVKGRPMKSITINSSNVVNLVAKFKAQTKINSTSDVVRLIILRIYEDLLRKQDQTIIKELIINEKKGEAVFYA